MRGCPRCGSARFELEAEGDGHAYVCQCGHVWAVNADRMHSLLNGRPVAKPLAKTCHHCGSEVDSGLLCNDCIRRTKNRLRSIPMLAAELDVVISKQARFAEQQQRVRGTPEPPLPMHPDAAAERDTLKAQMVSWVKWYEEETG